jgi:hypothetical protein
MDRSLRFRVYVTRLIALLGLAFASASPLGLTLPHNVTRRPIMQKVRGHALPCGHSAPTACRHTVSGTISLPSTGFFSPFPRGTSSLSVDQEYLALGDGPPRFPPDCTCPAVLGCPDTEKHRFRLRGCHPLWPAFQCRSASSAFSYSAEEMPLFPQNPTTPAQQRQHACTEQV